MPKVRAWEDRWTYNQRWGGLYELYGDARRFDPRERTLEKSLDGSRETDLSPQMHHIENDIKKVRALDAMWTYDMKKWC